MSGHPLVTALVMVALPLGVFKGGGAIMGKVSERHDLPDHAPLFMRVRGYDRNAVELYWGKLETTLGRKALDGERLFLELDLIFPFLYGAALGASLLLGWGALGKRFSAGWIVAPVALGVVADWTENLVQLRQLQRFMAAGGAGLESRWIAVASAATSVKIVVLAGASLFVLVLAVLVLLRGR